MKFCFCFFQRYNSKKEKSLFFPLPLQSIWCLSKISGILIFLFFSLPLLQYLNFSSFARRMLSFTSRLHPWYIYYYNVKTIRLNMELYRQSLFGLHVHCYTHWPRPRILQPLPPPRIWAHIRERYWSAKDRCLTSLCVPLATCNVKFAPKESAELMQI
jgi:hypothetical protein